MHRQHHRLAVLAATLLFAVLFMVLTARRGGGRREGFRAMGRGARSGATTAKSGNKKKK